MRKIQAYGTPEVEITSLDQAEEEVAFLKKSHSLGMWNGIYYINFNGGGFHENFNSEEGDEMTPWLEEILEDAKSGGLPSKYQVRKIIEIER